MGIKFNAMLEDNQQLALVTQHYAVGMHRYTSMEDTNSMVYPATLLISSPWRECQPTRISLGWLLFRCCCFFSEENTYAGFFSSKIPPPLNCLWQRLEYLDMFVPFSRAYETCPVEAADQTTHLPHSAMETISETSVPLFPISYAWTPSLGWEMDGETTPEHQRPGLTLIMSPYHDLNRNILQCRLTHERE